MNLAHGAFYALGAYFAYEVQRRLGFGGAVVLSPVGVALVGLVDRAALPAPALSRGPDARAPVHLRPRDDRRAEPAPDLGHGAGLNFSIPDALRGQLLLGDFIYSYYRLTVLAVTLLAVTGCWLLLNKTPFGMIVRAGTAIRRWSRRSASA